MIVACTQCGVGFKRRPSTVKERNFCSLSCVGKHQKKSVTVNCAECGVGFKRRPSTVKERNFCSPSCSQKHRKKSANVNCAECGVGTKVRPGRIREHNFCSPSCSQKHRKKSVTVNCAECGAESERRLSAVRERNFCSLSCSVTYTNKHKTHGYTRSRLELWIETKLTKRHPNLEIHYNQSNAIGMEFDIYIPSIKTAFEINGPTHYKPIYGEATLKSIKARDAKRKKLSRKNNIKLIEINTSKFQFHERKVKELNNYLNMIEQEIMKSIK